jgi:hypothetical protein
MEGNRESTEFVQKRKGKTIMSFYAEDVFIEWRSLDEEVMTTFYLKLSFGYKFQLKGTSHKKRGATRGTPF